VKSFVSRALRAAIVVIVCAAIAAACNSSSPVATESTFEAGVKASWLEASPLQINLGTTATTASITLKTTYSRSISWKASESAAWLTLGTNSGTLTSGSPKKIPLTIKRDGLAAGDYTATVAISSDRGGTEAVKVTMSVAASGTTTFSVSPLQIDFGTTATSLSVTLKNTSSQSLTWSATEGVGWLGLNTMSGTISANSQKTVAISVSRSGKTAGTYSTNVRFAAGTAGSGTVTATMIVPSSSGTVLLAGQLINQFSGSALSGITVQYAGKSATTNSAGLFTISGSPTSTLQQLTLSGSGVHRRVTYARTGDNKWRVVPSSFDMAAFNDLAREYEPRTIRWMQSPSIYIDTRAEGFAGGLELERWISEVRRDAPAFVSDWTGGMVGPGSVTVGNSPPPEGTPGTIVIHFSEDDQRYSGPSTVGVARTFWSGDRSIASAAVWLRFERYSGPAQANLRRAVLGHELGHALGMGHMNGSTSSIMTPSVSVASLTGFDGDAGLLLYTRSPGNTSPDVDSQSTYRGSLTPSRATGSYEWVCGAEARP